MAKYSGKDQVGTFGSVGLGCITSVDINITADTYTVVCGGQTYKERVVGPQDFMATVNYTSDTTSTALAALAAGASGTFTLSTNGTVAGYPQYSVSGIISGHSRSQPVEGICGGTVAIEGNGPYTITIP